MQRLRIIESFTYFVRYYTNTDYNDEISNRLIYDEERKYGEIPTEIYMLYFKSCGPWVIIIFGMSAIAWQTMKIYTDVWLRGWTDADESQRFNEVRVNKKLQDKPKVLHLHKYDSRSFFALVLLFIVLGFVLFWYLCVAVNHLYIIRNDFDAYRPVCGDTGETSLT